MNAPPAWVKRLIDVAAANFEWSGLGALACRITEDQELILAPAGGEVLGGANDGALVFPGYQLSVSGIAEAFDSPPEIHLNTQPRPHLLIEGTIGGEKAAVMVLTEPFDDDAHPFRLHPDGTWEPPLDSP